MAANQILKVISLILAYTAFKITLITDTGIVLAQKWSYEMKSWADTYKISPWANLWSISPNALQPSTDLQLKANAEDWHCFVTSAYSKIASRFKCVLLKRPLALWVFRPLLR